MNELLGNRIKELRKINQLTQEEIADQLGISRQKYARIENGQMSISLNILVPLANIFDVKVGDLTKVLDEPQVIEHRVDDMGASEAIITEMLDMFYANKHLYQRLSKDKNEG